MTLLKGQESATDKDTYLLTTQHITLFLYIVTQYFKTFIVTRYKFLYANIKEEIRQELMRLVKMLHNLLPHYWYKIVMKMHHRISITNKDESH